MARHETEMHRAKRQLETENVRLKLALKAIGELVEQYPNIRIAAPIAVFVEDALRGPQQPCDVGLFGERQSDLTDNLKTGE